MDDVLEVPQGRFRLRRAHHDDRQPLRAWDGADVLALEHLHTEAVAGGRWLVANDAFGALAVALDARAPTSWSDSHVAHLAAAANLDANDAGELRTLASTEAPTGPIDVAIVKIPRTIALLEHQLALLRPHLHERSVVLGAGMTKAVHTSTIRAFERAVGPTTTSRAARRARLLHAVVDPATADVPVPEPHRWQTPEGVEVTGWPNAYSPDRLDPGSALLLAHLPMPSPDATVLDLGCGTGVLAATVAHRQRDARVLATDESHHAIASARATLAGVDADIRLADGTEGIADATVDVVLLNPPFHVGGARTESVARAMFAGAQRVLAPEGELIVVGNRHLSHHVALRKWFRSVDVLGADPRFSVLRATGSR